MNSEVSAHMGLLELIGDCRLFAERSPSVANSFSCRILTRYPEC
jgi:hypothetical protein